MLSHLGREFTERLDIHINTKRSLHFRPELCCIVCSDRRTVSGGGGGGGGGAAAADAAAGAVFPCLAYSIVFVGVGRWRLDRARVQHSLV